MPQPTEQLIADALQRYLVAQLQARPAARAFFRISGFGPGVYTALLDTLAEQGWRLGQTAVQVRSIDPIAGYHDHVMEADRSATWYRNHLGRGEALVLIQNRLSSDAQSLKDLFSVTELALSRDGLRHLIDAAFTRYQLGDEDRNLLHKFVRRLAKVLYEPQLRDLVEFLREVDRQLADFPGSSIGHAIAQALPFLGLFRCLELENQLNTARGDKLIGQIYDAARIGSKVLDERTRQEYLERLGSAQLDDDRSVGGPGAVEKRTLLKRFIEGELRDNHEATLRVLDIEWREIQLVITAKNRATRTEKFNRTAEQLATHFSADEEPSEAVAAVLADLRGGREPDGDDIDSLLAEFGDSLPRPVRNDLRRLVKPRTRKHGDFLVGLTALAVELLHPLQAELQKDTQLSVKPNLDAVSDQKRVLEALAAFRALYGGIEQVIPAVDWQLEALWAQLAASKQPGDGDDDEERERDGQLELPFRIVVRDNKGSDIARATLVWQYRADSPAAGTAQTLAGEQVLLGQTDAGPLFAGETRLRVPVFNTCARSQEIGDLDIHRPIQSLGAWFEQPNDLRVLVTNALQRRVRPHVEAALDRALATLETAWASYIAVAANIGMLAADSGALLAAYEQLLRTAATELRTGAEASAGYRVLNQAWIVGTNTFEHWAVVPLLHPLKLLWWRERTRTFSEIIDNLLDPARPVQIVDEPRYRRELAATYGSSGFPPVLALPPEEGLPAERFLPVEEADGYELFFREAERGESFGLDADTLADDEAEIAAQRAVEGITAVVQDYIETYPFVRDGLEIVLYECRNGALPGLLVERLSKASERRGWKVRLSVIVHTSDRGAPLFQRVSEWVANDHATERRRGDYFPPVSLKVIQCSHEELLRTREDNDIVILADVLAERGQHIDSELLANAPSDKPLVGYLPTYRAQQEPFQQGELFRRLALSQPHQPAVVRLFELTQHAAISRKPVNADQAAQFFRELTLQEWERVLGQLHDHFNWVICYDTTIDRFLLQAAFPDKVQVIRYSLGLGAKRQHNLTVSSSHKAQTIVERRLAGRLSQMLPNAKPDFLARVSAQLVAQAKLVSGDIVLRAAGPGAFLNELIGLVVAKFETERRFRAQAPNALATWILLDDFEHWFGGGKFPDLLFVAIDRSDAGELQLHFEILEAKCVGQLSFATESADAEEQVRRGVSRLAPAFAANQPHLDALYWYDQLYRAVAGNLSVQLEQQLLWELFHNQFHDGTFSVTVEGHAWAFCYDSQISGGIGPDEHQITKPAPTAAKVPLYAHHFGRNELCQTLRDLIEAAGEHASDEMWTPAWDQGSVVEGQEDREIARQGDDEKRSEGDGVIGSEEDPETRKQGDTETNLQPPTSHIPHPTSQLLDDHEQRWLAEKARDLERALRQRGVQLFPIDPAQADVGPSIVRFKLRLRPNESLRKIQAVAEDLARDLALASTPIIDNVVRTNFVGVDIPRERSRVIDLQPSLARLGTPGPAELPIIIGVAPDGTLVTEDFSEFPHLLVAGATNSGKSVFLRSLLLSLITQYPVGKLELLIVDPKQTDFSFFDGLPYLRGGKVFVQPDEARAALLELVREEMPRRQQLMRGRSLKIKDFNRRFPDEALPPVVALIDEYAQLMTLIAKKEVEAFERDLMNLAAVARSVGIHLVLATQRPSADVVTSTLKANLDARIAFRVASSTNSRVVLDSAGADNLLGRGDMLFRRPSGEILRLQAPFMSEEQMQDYLDALRQR